MSRRAWPFVAVVLLPLLGACNANVTIDPEGYRCDPGDVCPEGYGCREGACRRIAAPPDPCDGVTCDAPPPASCVDPTLARTWTGQIGRAHV